MTDAAATQADESDPGAAARIRLARAAAHFRNGEFKTSADLALEAGALAMDAGRGDLLIEAALLVNGVPDPAAAAAVERLCRDALRVAGDGQLSERARLHAQLALALHHVERLDEAEVEAERSFRLATAANDPLAMAAALNARQLGLAGLGRGRELLELGKRMLTAATAAGTVEVELQARNWRIDALFRLGDTTAAAHEIDALDVLAVRSGDALVRWNARLSRAGLFHAIGRLVDAERLAREAREILPPVQRPHTEPLFIAQLMLIATDRGIEPPEVGVARGFAIGTHAIAAAMVGRFDLEMGDTDRARAAFEAIRPRLASVPMDRRAIATLTAGAELAVAFGDVASATELHERLQAFHDVVIASAIGAVGPVAYFLSRIEMLLGGLDEAVDHAAKAIELAARGDFGPWLARSRLAHAEALALRNATGDRVRARESAAFAIVTARQLEMGPLLRRALAVHERLAAPARISPREREIVACVALGWSNGQIARSLGLSERTVETHVQHILTKLDFHSRAQIAAWAVGQGIRTERKAASEATDADST